VPEHLVEVEQTKRILKILTKQIGDWKEMVMVLNLYG
jgi:hypothetical protein